MIEDAEQKKKEESKHRIKINKLKKFITDTVLTKG
jgi:hypothetical protein